MPERMSAMPSAATWVGNMHGRGTIICSVCAGAFVVAQTGLLSGRRVTTHWAYAELLALRFPDVQVVTDTVVIDDGDLITAGAILAWNDLGLMIVARLLGASVMLATSRFMLSEGVRDDQRPFQAYPPKLDHDDTAILKSQHLIHAHPGVRYTISSLSACAGLTERTFLRRFQKSTGLKPTEYIKRVRMTKARNALQLGGQSVNEIAASLGYDDSSSFRKAFRAVVGLSPQAFRARFRIR